MKITRNKTTTEHISINLTEADLEEIVLHKLRHDGSIPFEARADVTFVGSDSHEYRGGGALIECSFMA